MTDVYMADGLKQLKEKYEQMAALTRPKCLNECPEPGGCCRPDYCDMADTRAREFGVVPPVQQHPILPFMGPKGCVLPAYLRPLCAVHVCEIHLLNGGPFAEAYLALRGEVVALEKQFGPGWPEGMAKDYWE